MPMRAFTELIVIIIHLALHFINWFLGFLILSKLNGIIDMGQNSCDGIFIRDVEGQEGDHIKVLNKLADRLIQLMVFGTRFSIHILQQQQWVWVVVPKNWNL
jgi:hypothetical protein